MSRKDIDIRSVFFLVIFGLFLLPALHAASEDVKEEVITEPLLNADLKAEKIPSKTDDNVIQREEQKQSADGYSVEEQKMMREKAEKFEFQAEVNRVMNIIINSLYSNKEIFLRELISNASDALDKIRFISLTAPNELGEHTKLEIKVEADPENNVLHIIDTGVGMTKEDLISKLGTIAKSGTKEFLDAVKSSDMNLIGQFGVGFYSAFLVADSITVTTKNNNDPKQWIWESTADNSFTITEDPHGNTLGRGTRLTLHLKKEAKDYLKQETLQKLIKKYSEFINFPILLWTSQEVPVEETPAEAEPEAETEKEGEKESETLEVKDEDEKPKQTPEKSKDEKPKTKTVFNWTLQNESKPIWLRNAKEITDDEYKAFFKSFAKDSSDPLSWLHFAGEGEIEFRSILYIPDAPPANLYEPDKSKEHKGLRLYVKRVFITDDFSDMFPRYLNFIKGIVDSENLPLNVSREILQQDRTLALIKKKLVRKAIAMIQTLAEDNEKYLKFWEKYGTNIKLGLADDAANRARLSKLLRFYSSKTQALTSLEDYVSRMKEGQNQIYYIAGDSLETVAHSPFVEKLLNKGYEILYMTEAIDEWALQSLPKFDNTYTLVNAAKDGLSLKKETEDDKKKETDLTNQFTALLEFLGSKLKGRISKAVISKNLVKTPSAINSGAYGFTGNMERLLKAQAFSDQKQFNFMKSQRILEVNPRHPIIQELNKRLIVSESDAIASDLAEILYDTASLHSGFSVDDPAGFSSRIHRMMKLSLNLDASAEAEEEVETEEDIKSEETTEQIDFSEKNDHDKPEKDEL